MTHKKLNFSSSTKEDKIGYQLQHYKLQPLMTFEIQIGSQFHVSSDCADADLPGRKNDTSLRTSVIFRKKVILEHKTMCSLKYLSVVLPLYLIKE